MGFNRTLTKDIGTTLTTVRSTASATSDVVIGMRITNTSAAAIKVSACITNGSTNYYLVGGPSPATTGADVAVGGSIVIINGDIDKVVMLPGDTIKVISSANTSCDCIISVLEN